MTTTNKIKAVSKIGTLALAAAAYIFLGSNQAGVEVDMQTKNNVALQDTTYQTIPQEDGGPSDPQVTGTREQLKGPGGPCPDAGQLCAIAVNPPDPSNQLFWNGGSTKF